MTTDVLGYLASKGLHVKRADKRNVNLPCPFCQEPEGKRGRLYVNVDDTAEIPGLYFCHLCGAKGSLKSIQRFYGDDTSTGEDAGIIHYDVLDAAATFFHKALNNHPEAIDYYRNGRGLERETVVKYKLGWADGNVIPHLKNLGHTDEVLRQAGIMLRDGTEFYRDVYTIPYYVGPTCVGIRQKEPGGKYKQPSGYSQRPFGTDNIKMSTEQVVITEGEFDAMIAEQLGYVAIGCPGATGWQEAYNTYLRDVKRIWVVFDNDDAGRKGSERTKEMIGPRARALTVPPKPGGHEEDANDISDWIIEQGHTASDFEALLNKNKGTFLISVAEAMEEWHSVQGVEGLKFNYLVLDTLLHPGLLPGQVIITLAKTNTGKTIWLENTMELMAQGNEDLTFLFMSLEQTRGEWFERAQRIHAFWRPDLWPEDDHDQTIEHARKAFRQAAYEWWSPRFMMTDRNRMTEDHIRATLDDYVLEYGKPPSVLAIDYLGYLARGFRGKDKYAQVTEAVMSVKEISKDYGTVTLLPHQVNRIGSFGQKLEIDMARDSGAVEETGDMVFILYNPDHGKDPSDPSITNRVHLHIGKSRHGGKGRDLTYGFGKRTLVMVPEGRDKEIVLACNEDNYPMETWERALWRHRVGKRF